MAQIDPRNIEYSTECYAAVSIDVGFICGRLKGWKLYDLKNPDLHRTLSQSPNDIKAAFETRDELEQWRIDLYKEPAQKPDDVALKVIGTKGGDKLIISQIL